jgi:hypothetical protein
MRTFKIPRDLLHNVMEDTKSNTVRVALGNGYIEFMAEGDYVEVRCMGNDLPAITMQPVTSNVIRLLLQKTADRL